MLWRVERPAHALTLTGHLQGLSDAAWSPDSCYLSTASDDQTVRIFDCATGQAVRVFHGHQSYVCCCAYSPRGNIVASGSYDETVKLWDVRTARCIRSFGAHSDPVVSVDFVWDGTMLATASFDGLCRVWDTASGTCIKTLLTDSNPFVFAPQHQHQHQPPLRFPKPLHSTSVPVVRAAGQIVRQGHAQRQELAGGVFGQHAAAVEPRTVAVCAALHRAHRRQVQRGVRVLSRRWRRPQARGERL